MNTTRMKNFLQLQCCMLVALLSVLPQFDLVAAIIGFDLNLMIILCKLVAVIGGGLALYRLNQIMNTEGKNTPVLFLALAGLGLLIVLISIAPVLPVYVEYLAVILLGIALYMSKTVCGITWQKEAMRGAYLILLALCLHVFNGIDNTTMTKIGALVGLVLYILGLGVMKNSLDAAGVQGCDKLKIAVILSLVSIVVDWIPLFGWLATVLLIIAFAFEYMGYGLLKTSSSLGTGGQNGAGKLQISMIVLLIGAVLGFIPIIGSIFEGIAGLVALLLIFIGWSNILLGMETETVSVKPEIDKM